MSREATDSTFLNRLVDGKFVPVCVCLFACLSFSLSICIYLSVSLTLLIVLFFSPERKYTIRPALFLLNESTKSVEGGWWAETMPRPAAVKHGRSHGQEGRGPRERAYTAEQVFDCEVFS